MTRLARADGLFRRIHDELTRIEVDFAALDPSAFDEDLVQYALDTWATRVQTEFRSVQVMTRFCGEVLAAGDPLEVWAGAADAILDEIRHTALCVGIVEALGGQPALPDPLEERENPEFARLSPAERALGTAVSMLAVSETLSTGFIADLHARATHPVVREVLNNTLVDEDMHHAYGWAYVEASLGRFDASAREYGAMVARETIRPHRERAEQALADVPLHRRHLDAWPEPDLAALGLLSPQREALLFERTLQTTLGPKLEALGLL